MLLLAAGPAFANDANAQIGLGGVQLRPEPRIEMADEHLTITADRVTVAYEFVNHGKRDVTTFVALPLPSIEPWSEAVDVSEWNDRSIDARNIVSFRLWVNERPTNFEVHQRIVPRGRDVTSLVHRASIEPYHDRHDPETAGVADPRAVAELPRLRAWTKWGDPQWSVRPCSRGRNGFPPAPSRAFAMSTSP